MTLAELEASIAMLRRQGVAKYRDIAGGGFEVEFAPAPLEMKAGDIPAEPSRICKCGHDLDAEHQAGLCIRSGCDPLTCSPEGAP